MTTFYDPANAFFIFDDCTLFVGGFFIGDNVVWVDLLV